MSIDDPEIIELCKAVDVADTIGKAHSIAIKAIRLVEKYKAAKVAEQPVSILPKQEPLGAEFQKVIDDNFSELLVRDWNDQETEQPDECGCDWFAYSDGTPYQRHHCKAPMRESVDAATLQEVIRDRVHWHGLNGLNVANDLLRQFEVRRREWGARPDLVHIRRLVTLVRASLGRKFQTSDYLPDRFDDKNTPSARHLITEACAEFMEHQRTMHAWAEKAEKALAEIEDH